jgi:hypothetical protein
MRKWTQTFFSGTRQKVTDEFRQIANPTPTSSGCQIWGYSIYL